MLKRWGLRPILELDLRLGEGQVQHRPCFSSTPLKYNKEMGTFGEAGVSSGIIN